MVESKKKLAAMAYLGEIIVAFDAEHVVGVEADTSARESIIDVPALLGLEWESEEPRVIAFGEGAGNMALRLGHRVWFEDFEPRSVRMVPSFLSGMEVRNAVVGVLEREKEMVLMLDIEWLRAIERRGEQ